MSAYACFNQEIVTLKTDERMQHGSKQIRQLVPQKTHYVGLRAKSAVTWLPMYSEQVAIPRLYLIPYNREACNASVNVRLEASEFERCGSTHILFDCELTKNEICGARGVSALRLSQAEKQSEKSL